MRLAILAPTRSTYSETFIAMQMRCLAPELRLHGTPVVNETSPGGGFGLGAFIRTGLHPLRLMSQFRAEDSMKGRARTVWHLTSDGEVLRRLKRHRIEVLLVNFGTAAVQMAPICSRLDISLVVHFHGVDAHLTSLIAKHHDDYVALGKIARRVIAVSHAMREALIKTGIPSEKIEILRYGADRRFGELKRDNCAPNPLFFGVGRFVDKKAQYLTIMAFKQVLEEFPLAKLVLGGDGPLLEVSQNLVQALGLDHAVEFLGVLAPDQVIKYMAQATAFVQHSLQPRVGPYAGDCEGTPVAVLEAMAAGLPVVATRHTGIGEVIEHGVTGLLVNERDVNSMAREMIRLIESPDFAAELGQNARKAAMEHYTEDKYIAGLNAVLLKV